MTLYFGSLCSKSQDLEPIFKFIKYTVKNRLIIFKLMLWINILFLSFKSEN